MSCIPLHVARRALNFSLCEYILLQQQPKDSTKEMENNRTRRPQSPAIPPQSPGLFRSKSRSSPAAVTVPENNSCAASTSQRSPIVRSKSVTRSRSKKDEENVNPSTLISGTQKKVARESKAGFAKFFQRGSSIISAKTGGGSKGAIKTCPASSPSAWALSPGRSLGSPLAPPPESAATEGGRGKSSRDGGGGVSGVLRYFGKKGSSSAIQEEFHRFRILQNRLLQWRFANVRAETAVASVKSLTEDRIFSVWLHNLRMRNRIVERRIQVEKLRNEIKLYRIIFPQMTLLNQWAKLDKRNQESVGNLASILSAVSLRLPLLQGAKGDTVAFQQAMSMAMEGMTKIEATITKCTSQQVEKMLYMLTERLSVFKEQEECLERLHKAICFVTTLLGKENSVRAQLVQAIKAGRNNPIT